MQVNIEPVIRDMAMWALGFAAFSVVYLIVGVWLIRRRRAAREAAKKNTSGSKAPALQETQQQSGTDDKD